MRRALRLAPLPILFTVALLVTVLLLPGRADEAFHVYVLALAAFGLLHLLVALHAGLPDAGPSPVDSALQRKRAQPQRLAEIERIEQRLTLAQATAFDVHFWLRPTLRRIAGELLRSRRGIDLDTDTDAARRALGDETWELVRPDREPPEDRFGPGLPLPALRRVVDSLEAI